jgi:hypothetical protein
VGKRRRRWRGSYTYTKVYQSRTASPRISSRIISHEARITRPGFLPRQKGAGKSTLHLPKVAGYAKFFAEFTKKTLTKNILFI